MMTIEELHNRISELETKAKNKYCECVDWREVIYMLHEDEQEEYNRLIKLTGA